MAKRTLSQHLNWALQQLQSLSWRELWENQSVTPHIKRRANPQTSVLNPSSTKSGDGGYPWCMECLQPQSIWVQPYQNCWHVFRGGAANRDLMWHCSCFMQKSIKLLKASAESKKTQDEKGQQFFWIKQCCSSNFVARLACFSFLS